MTERRTNPLSDALSAAEHSPEAQAYEVPVELIRSRSRRRRRARTGTAAGALALVVAGAAVVVPNLPSRTPAPATDELAGAALCGQSTSDLSSGSGLTRPLPNGGDVPAGVRIAEGSVVVPEGGGPWSLTTVTGETTSMESGEVSAEPVTGPPVGWVYGTSVALLRDGVVVAASDGPGAPSIDDAVAMAADFGTTAFPLSTEDEFALVACTGDAVEAGDYELVAVQTYGWTYESGGTWAARQASAPVQVRVERSAPVDPPTSAPPAVCGLSVEDLAADDGGEGASTLDVLIDATSTPADAPWAVATRIELPPPPGAFTLESVGWTYGTTVALVQDGRVVGALEDHEAATREQAARTDVDVEPAVFPIVEDLAGRMISCATGEAGVAPGDYQLVASTTIGFVPKSDPDAKPSIARATSDPVDVTVSAAPSASDPLVCGAPDDGLRALAGTGPLVLRAESAPSSAPSGADTSFTVDVTNESDETVTASTGHPQVILTRDGVIVGGLEPQEDIGFDVDLDPGRSQSFDAASLLTSCTDGGSAGEQLPPGEYEMWAVMSFTPTDGTGRDPAAGWQTAGGPWPLVLVTDDPEVPVNGWYPSCGDTTAFLADRAAATAAGDVTLEVTEWANPDSAVRDRWLSQIDAALTLTNGSDEPVTVRHIGLSASQGGTVVGQGLVYAVADERLTVTIDPGETVSLPRPLKYGDLLGCERNGFPAGELEGWVIVDTDAGALVLGPHPLEATE